MGIKLNKSQIEYLGYYDPDFPDGYEGQDIELAEYIYSNFDVIYDGMCEDYIYIGEELFESDDGRYTPWDFAETFPIQKLIDIRADVHERFHFSDDFTLPYIWRKDYNLVPELHVFVHLT